MNLKLLKELFQRVRELKNSYTYQQIIQEHRTRFLLGGACANYYFRKYNNIIYFLNLLFESFVMNSSITEQKI